MDKSFILSHKEQLLYLISDKENDIWKLIYYHIYGKKVAHEHSAAYIEHLLYCYITLSEILGDYPEYKSLFEFFCYYNPKGKKEYKRFIAAKAAQKDECFDEDDLGFILKQVEEEICEFVANVLNNDKDDPHFSGVTATNEIKFYIAVMKDLGEALPYDDVRGFFSSHGFTPEQFEAFEASRINESSYYIGVQY